MAITITAAEIKEVERKYRLRFQPNSGRARAWALFEQGVGPAAIAYQNLLPGLREVTIHSYIANGGGAANEYSKKKYSTLRPQTANEIKHKVLPNT